MCRSALGNCARDKVFAPNPIESNKNHKINTTRIVHDNGMRWRRKGPKRNRHTMIERAKDSQYFADFLWIIYMYTATVSLRVRLMGIRYRGVNG